TKFDALSKAWNESEAETKKAESALKETEADFTKAEQNFDKLSPEQKASIKKDAEAVSEAIDESFSKEQVADNPAMQERLNRVRKVLDRLKQAE
ncbi:MAG: hypothetical protein KDB07_10660, partial [Planctomycetes bacterium]|nr:hypothetical protein [Planctomycetota bacterium]